MALKNLLFFAILNVSIGFAQTQSVNTNILQHEETTEDFVLVIQKKTGNQKKRYILENKRIRVSNATGAHASGKLQIVSPDTIIVGTQKIAFSEITRINLYSRVFRTTGFILGGFSGFLNLYLLAFGEPEASLGILPVTGAFFTLTLISRRYNIVDKHRAYFLKS